MANIPEGYELLSGHSRENARKALSLAQERGFPVETVLSVKDGYHVPLEGTEPPVIGGYVSNEPDEIVSDSEDGEPVEIEGVPLEDHTVAELKDLAEKDGIDLGGATKKADIIAAIESSDKVPVLGADDSEGE